MIYIIVLGLLILIGKYTHKYSDQGCWILMTFLDSRYFLKLGDSQNSS